MRSARVRTEPDESVYDAAEPTATVDDLLSLFPVGTTRDEDGMLRIGGAGSTGSFFGGSDAVGRLAYLEAAEATLTDGRHIAATSLAVHAGISATARLKTCSSADCATRRGRGQEICTIFEGTSEIQRLVIARAISGIHIK